MIGIAHKMGLMTIPYAFNQDEPMEMGKSGADIIVAHMGLTTYESIWGKNNCLIRGNCVSCPRY